jgi:adenosine deaminase
MKITISINTDNAAFEDKDAEVYRILQEWLMSVQRMGLDDKTLHDSNGNTVGSVVYWED